jgi:hypothetical protein
MELTLTPGIDENGILCLCGSTKDKVYTTKKKISTHIKTQKHQNKANHYVKLTEALELIDNQKKS